MVALAKDCKTVGTQLSYSTPTDKQGYDIPYASQYSGGVVLTASIGASDMAIRKLEHVQLIININARARGDIVIVLEAPTATKSVLLTRRPRDYRSTMDWTFMTVRHWDESPLGDWKIYISNANAPNRDAQVVAWSLKLYGTSGADSVTSCPQGKYLSAAGECQACHDECTSAGCTGPGPLKCTSCLHYHTADGQCVFDCADEKMLNPTVEHGQCLPCHDSCDGVSFKQGRTVDTRAQLSDAGARFFLEIFCTLFRSSHVLFSLAFLQDAMGPRQRSATPVDTTRLSGRGAAPSSALQIAPLTFTQMRRHAPASNATREYSKEHEVLGRCLYFRTCSPPPLLPPSFCISPCPHLLLTTQPMRGLLWPNGR
jgi:subtilisin-like proprotein convertase family protein